MDHSSRRDEEQPSSPWKLFGGSDNLHDSNKSGDDLVDNNNNSINSTSDEDNSNEPVIIPVAPLSIDEIGIANEDRPHRQPPAEDGEQDPEGADDAQVETIAEGYLARDHHQPQEERIRLPTAVPADPNDELMDQQEYDEMKQQYVRRRNRAVVMVVVLFEVFQETEEYRREFASSVSGFGFFKSIFFGGNRDYEDVVRVSFKRRKAVVEQKFVQRLFKTSLGASRVSQLESHVLTEADFGGELFVRSFVEECALSIVQTSELAAELSANFAKIAAGKGSLSTSNFASCSQSLDSSSQGRWVIGGNSWDAWYSFLWSTTPSAAATTTRCTKAAAVTKS